MKIKKIESLEKRIYSHEEVLAESLKYFNGDNLATDTWVRKYALKDLDNKYYELSPDDMHKRLTREFAKIENKYQNPMTEEQIYNSLKNFRYVIPQGSPMAGIGNNFQIVSLSNCFVIGEIGKNADSYGTIMKIDEEQVQLMKRRGGVGHDLSGIRPKNSYVQNSALTSTGIVPFMERYSNSTKEVAQEGRRGALMLSLNVRHPDAENFIDAKLQEGKVTGANISIKLNDDFMNAVEKNLEYTQQFPIDSPNPIFTKRINAKNLWNKIIHNAWKKAEPGVLFWDTIIRESIPDCYADLGFKTVSTNPCGEIPLCPYDSCRLLAVNLYRFVDKPFTKDATFNSQLFKEQVRVAQRISDDIIDLELEKIDKILEKIESDPEDENVKFRERELWNKIKKTAEKGRRIGLGSTGEGDMLAALGLRYGSDEAIKFATEVQKTLALTAYRSSVELAKERGAFQIYDAEREKNNPFIQRIRETDSELYENMIKSGRRNIALLTIAPTGTVSIMTQTTSGIEPVFSPYYERKTKINVNDKNLEPDEIDEEGNKWKKYAVFHHGFENWLKINGYNFEEVRTLGDNFFREKDGNKKRILEQQLKEIVSKSPYYKANAMDLDWVSKVKMQGAIQKWVDHSISSTVNLPEEITEEKVREVYLTAWKEGCKGVTIYREGSRKGILKSGKGESGLERKALFPDGRPPEVEGDIRRFKNTIDKKSEGEDWIAFIGKTPEGKPFEIFTGKSEGDVLQIPKNITKGIIRRVKSEDPEGRSRYDFIYKNSVGFKTTLEGINHQFNPEYWNYARLTSGLLNEGAPLVNVIKIVEKLYEANEGFNTWKKGVLRAFKKYIQDGTDKGVLCPKCNQPIIFQEGCEKCDCGSKCE